MSRRNSGSAGEAGPYWSPIVAGMGLGLTVLAAYLALGHGIGASGGLTAATAAAANLVAPEAATRNALLGAYLPAPGGGLPVDPLVLLPVGILLGAHLSGRLAGRLTSGLTRGPHAAAWIRVLGALLGGMLMGLGARLARGCTSGQALSGGALMSVGAWVFMVTVFAGGFALSILVRRLWR